MDISDEEVIQLWKAFHKHKLRYIMVGGFATNLHGFNRITNDLDIWIQDSIENRKILQKALEEMGIENTESFLTTQFIPGWTGIILPSGFSLDIMTYLKGFEQSRFEECFELASTAIIYEIPVKFLHLNHLIESKKASARPKDMIDLDELEKIRKASSE
jgi:hypothetical protein